MVRKRIKTTGKVMAMTWLVIFSGMSQAEPMDLTDVPLFLQQSVPPAIALSFDNSSKTQKTSLFYVEDYEANLPRFREAVAAPEINVIYYNPEYTYKPPLRADGTSFPNSSFTAAWNDGFRPANCGTTDLSQNYKLLVSYNSINCNGNNFTNNDRGEPAYYYDFEDGSTDYGDKNKYSQVIIPNDQKQNFANWFSYYKTRNMLIKTSASRAFGVLDENFKIAWQSFKQNNAFEVDMMPMKGAHKRALWDWLFNLKGGGSDAMNNAMIEAGNAFETNHQWYYEDGVGSSVADELECQQNFHVVLTNNYANGPSTDFSEYTDELTGSSVGDFTYTGTGESAVYKNSDTRTFADLAFHYWAKDIHDHLPNKVPRFYSDNLRADGSRWDEYAGTYWYEDEGVFWNPANDPANWQHMVNFVIGFGLKGVNDMPQLEEIVKPDGSIDYRVVNPPVFYDYRDGTTEWPTTAQGNQAKDAELDDMWHAALNSRGEFLNVRSPGQLEHALTALLERLKQRRQGSSSVATISSNIVTENTALYRTNFNSADWSGEVIAQRVEANGDLGEILWEAGCLLTGGTCRATGETNVIQSPTPSNRKIFTYDRVTKTQKDFKADSLSLVQLAHLAKARQVQNLTAEVSDVINYLRGEQNLEQRNGGVFRNRRSLLGDVIHSSARVLRAPGESYQDFAFPESSNVKEDERPYAAFRNENRDRQNILLVGANDGMLHAFEAETGKELWAYIPSQALENMHLLTDPDYDHQNYVDSTPSVRDIYVDGPNGGWRSVAYGGLRLGGQGYYAIDVTNPLQPKVLWEFTDHDDVDMGYSYGETFVTRLSNDKWVAFLPNGYNNIVDDGRVGSGTSVMFMVDAFTGELIKKYDTGEGDYDTPNGMAGAVVSDVPYNITGDSVFFGDLRGDMYRLKINNFPGSWDNTYGDRYSDFVFEKMINTINPYNTPISTTPRLTQRILFSEFPNQVILHYGTGKYLESKDKTVIPPDIYQYVVSVFDQLESSEDYPIDVLNNDNFVEQSIETNGEYRYLSSETVEPYHHGWFIKLPVLGERIIAKMTRRLSAYFLIFSSFIPNANSGCSTGGASWLMISDTRTGGVPLTTGSAITDGSGNRLADGVYVENQIFGLTPIAFAGGGGELLRPSIDDPTGGQCEQGDEDCTSNTILIPDFTWRRRSWNRIDI